MKQNARTPFSKFKNELIEKLKLELDSKFDNTTTFINLVWFQSFLGIERHLIENEDEVMLEMSREKFTKATAQLHELFGSGVYNEMMSIMLYDTVTELCEVARSLSTKFCYLLRVLCTYVKCSQERQK